MGVRYRGVLFDLFGTLVHFDVERLPRLALDGQRLRTTVGGLEHLLAEWVPGVPLATFARALFTVSEEMARARAYDHVELPSRERFRRALERVGCDDDRLAEGAVSLSRAHLELIATATAFPAAHAALLASLIGRYRLGVVSNFDDTAAAYGILLRHRIAGALDTIVISEALGLRKPHPALVRVGVRGLGLEPAEVLFVGDTFAEDVAAASAAGVDAAWIAGPAADVPPGAPPPRFVIRTLPEIAGILGSE